MNGTTRYFILKKTDSKLNQKSTSNTHLFFIPIDQHQYMYLGLIGQLTDEENTYAAQLFVKLPEDILEMTINGEFEFFGDRLEEVESIECSSSNLSPGKYSIKFPKKGVNVKSDLEVEYQMEYSTTDRRIYFIKGHLNLIANEVEENESDMSQIAARQVKIMGGKKRLKEMVDIVSDRRLFEVSCKEKLMRIVQESDIINKKLSLWQKKDLYSYIKEMSHKEVSDLLFNEGIKIVASGAALAIGATYLYRKLSDPCIKRYPLNSLERNKCQLSAIKQVIDQIKIDMEKCDNSVNKEQCMKKANEELNKWKSRYERHLHKIIKQRGNLNSPFIEKIKNAKL